MLIAGNWKMYKWPSETAEFCVRFRAAFSPAPGLQVVVCPPFTSLREAVGSGLTTYSQNVHWQAEGPYTGEISAEMLLELGVLGAIVGHSERRQHFGETDETTARRAERALEAGLAVIACVGETEDERERGETDDVLRRQVSVLPEHERLVVAYEPVWAIGTGKTATPEDAQEVIGALRNRLADKFGNTADRVRILYGGSVKGNNVAAIMAQPDIDGALVGGASLDPKDFTLICRLGV